MAIDTTKKLTRNGLKKTGDTMFESPGDPGSGWLTLAKDAVEPLHAVPLRQLQAGQVSNGFDERHIGMYQQTGRGTAISTLALAALTTNGTATLLSDTSGIYVNYASTTSLGAQAGYSNAAVADYTMDALPDITFVCKTGALASDIADVRIWIGLTTLTGLGVGEPINFVGFRYNPVERSDTTWQALSSDGVGGGPQAINFTLTNTTVPVAVDTRLVFRIRVTALASVQFYVQNVLRATHTTNFPASLQALNIAGYAINAVAGTARNFRVRRWASLMR